MARKSTPSFVLCVLNNRNDDKLSRAKVFIARNNSFCNLTCRATFSLQPTTKFRASSNEKSQRAKQCSTWRIKGTTTAVLARFNVSAKLFSMWNDKANSRNSFLFSHAISFFALNEQKSDAKRNTFRSSMIFWPVWSVLNATMRKNDSTSLRCRRTSCVLPHFVVLTIGFRETFQ